METGLQPLLRVRSLQLCGQWSVYGHARHLSASHVITPLYLARLIVLYLLRRISIRSLEHKMHIKHQTVKV